MTIEETNKLRLSMGLKPLRLTNASKEKEVNLSKSREDVAEEVRQKALQDALAKSKQKRQFTEKLKGQSLGEALRSEGPKSALDWVRQSRTSKAPAIAPATSTSAATTAKYDAADLKGLTVAHDAHAFEEGDEVILTLKDQRVLTDDRSGVNDESDELENVDLREADSRAERDARMKKATGPVYSGFDDDEFTTILGGSKKGVRKPVRLLAQYDEEEELAALRESKKFALGDVGVHQVQPKHPAKSQQVDGDDDDGPVSISLASHKKQHIEEYFTASEMAVFSKKQSKKLRKKQKMRQSHHADDDTETTASLVEQLEVEASRNQPADHGKRSAEPSDVAIDEITRRNRFELARQRANDKVKTVMDRMKQQPVAVEDIDEELGESLARSRRMALVVAAAKAKQDTSSSETSNDLRVLQQISAFKEESAVPHGGDASHGPIQTIVFSEATDFDVRVKNALEEREAARAASAAGAVGGASSVPARPTKTVTVEEELSEDDKSNDIAMEETKDESESEDENSWGVEEPLVQTGMAATLALLRNRGDLKETVQVRQAGRANDHRDKHIEDELQVKDGVKLDYRDEFGRLLTKKEAFRRISYRFHGHTPGKKKQEKRLKQIKEELMQQKNLGNVVARMQTLDKRQKVAKQAHVVLSGK
ncbi:hypothetical protein, variant [Aphanomyces invadans]|nr:hypothetical protein, variant [Aphanomyces invadans]ETV98831.1 hypothetical protein, variant [Aphanomyces invadans]RHY27589.1 hypothetical protein DYB32_006670 [Aphanomyces invadans]|eukprot:XP_008872258.1 hypothetical protein, variant [Aphanomyces invadans]